MEFAGYFSQSTFFARDYFGPAVVVDKEGDGKNLSENSNLMYSELPTAFKIYILFPSCTHGTAPVVTGNLNKFISVQ